MFVLDATCPLVSKVHLDAERHHAAGRELIPDRPRRPYRGGGHARPTAPTARSRSWSPRRTWRASSRAIPENLAFVTQTTLSVDDTQGVVEALRARFPAIVGPHGKDICYATTNRQDAVKAIAPGCDLMLVVGSPTSSNSMRLVEVALRAGARSAHLLGRRGRVGLGLGSTALETLGLTAGASAPDGLVDEVMAALAAALHARRGGGRCGARGRDLQAAASADGLTARRRPAVLPPTSKCFGWAQMHEARRGG